MPQARPTPAGIGRRDLGSQIVPAGPACRDDRRSIYLGIGTLVVIVIIVLIVLLLRR